MPDRHPNANANQRARRTRRPRIDYYPSPGALAAIEARRSRYGPANNYSGILDAIIAEWVQAEHLKKAQVDTPASLPEAPEFSYKYAHARETSESPAQSRPEFIHTSRACAPARVTSAGRPHARAVRVICGAKRRCDGQPCQALSLPGKRRCKWHGGCSTGPRTDAGRAKALANLRQHQRRPC